MTFDFIKNKKYFFTFSIIIMLIGFVAFLFKGFVMDIDFKGGTIITVNMGQAFENKKVEDIVKAAVNKNATVQKLGPNQDQAMIKMEPLTADERDKVFEAVRSSFNLTAADKLGINDVQPIMGDEMRQKGVTAVIVASLLMLAYIALRFRTMSGISAGVTAVLGLVHDLLIMMSVYSIFSVPVNGSFIAACLTILGYSINDTIIIYDRIRENQRFFRKANVGELVNKSINQTLTRSINTVVTVLITLISLYIAGLIYGVTSIVEFTFPLIIGIASGMYSSICICSPLWVLWRDMASKKVTGKKPAKA